MSTSGNTQRARGFASMDAAKQKEIASRGGRAAHAHGTAHKFSSDEARRAGRKGGEAVSGNREHMATIGRRGGEARQARRAARAQTEGPKRENTTPVPAESAITQRLDTQAANESTGSVKDSDAQGTQRADDRDEKDTNR